MHWLLNNLGELKQTSTSPECFLSSYSGGKYNIVYMTWKTWFVPGVVRGVMGKSGFTWEMKVIKPYLMSQMKYITDYGELYSSLIFRLVFDHFA